MHTVLCILADLPWRTKAGVTACAFLLRRAVHMGADTSANQADERATASTIKACWAWCLQQAACDILPLQNRSLDLESMEQAARAWWPLRAAAGQNVLHPGTADAIASQIKQQPLQLCRMLGSRTLTHASAMSYSDQSCQNMQSWT